MGVPTFFFSVDYIDVAAWTSVPKEDIILSSTKREFQPSVVFLKQVISSMLLGERVFRPWADSGFHAALTTVGSPLLRPCSSRGAPSAIPDFFSSSTQYSALIPRCSPWGEGGLARRKGDVRYCRLMTVWRIELNDGASRQRPIGSR